VISGFCIHHLHKSHHHTPSSALPRSAPRPQLPLPDCPVHPDRQSHHCTVHATRHSAHTESHPRPPSACLGTPLVASLTAQCTPLSNHTRCAVHARHPAPRSHCLIPPHPTQCPASAPPQLSQTVHPFQQPHHFALYATQQRARTQSHPAPPCTLAWHAHSCHSHTAQCTPLSGRPAADTHRTSAPAPTLPMTHATQRAVFA
jgi:hypothetical protein